MSEIASVSIARPLVANNDLVRYFERGEEVPEQKRCTYCNKCLLNTLENPLGCYELSRYDGDYDAMIRQVMTVYEPKSFREGIPAMPIFSGEPAESPLSEG